MKILLAAVLALGAGGLLAAPEPSMRDFVESARVIVHLKVLSVVETGAPVDPKVADGRHSPDIVLCAVREFIFGALDTDAQGRVAMTSASSKGKGAEDGVSYAPGAEVTLICDKTAPDARYGSRLDGGGPAARRPSGAPEAGLRRALKRRTDRAFALIDALSGPLREAADSVRAQLELRSRRKLPDLSSLTPEQDLLADIVAVTLGEPGLCDCARPDIGRADRQRLVRLALQHAFEREAEQAELLAPLFEAAGNGMHALLRPAEGSAGVLRGMLERIDGQRGFGAMLAELVRADRADYAPWLAALLESDWNRAERIGELCSDLMDERALGAAELAAALEAPASARLPYDDAGVRALARVLDAGSPRLFLRLEAGGTRWPGDAGVSKRFTDRSAHNERAGKADTAYGSDHALVLLLWLSLDDAGSKDKDRPSAHLAARIQQAQRKAGQAAPTLATPRQIAAEAEKRKVKVPDELLARVEAME